MDTEHSELGGDEPGCVDHFAAREVGTDRAWDELVVGAEVREQLEELNRWAQHSGRLEEEWGMKGKLRPGFRALFHGPSGTGKTFAATLLGRQTGRKVMRVPLAPFVSKYVGETHEHVKRLIDEARREGWILFFDEADALFGKRTDVKDAHDRYANLEVSYLLQELEGTAGLVILAANLRAGIDPAFVCRVNAVVEFPFPDESQRAAIWRASLPGNVRFEGGDGALDRLSRFELTGGNIVQVVQHACLAAMARGADTILVEDALTGIRREMKKEGRSVEDAPA